MKPLDRLSDYLGAIERRLRLLVLSRGAAVIAGAALALTVVAVLLANHYAFSKPSVLTARMLLFLGLAAAIAAALIVPLLRLNRRRAAREAESKYPQFEERLLTFTERMEQNSADPFLPLLADDALSVAQQAEPKHVTRSAWIFSFSSIAVTSLAVLLWVGSGTGFLGYGTSLLWGGLPKGNVKPFYSIQVDPGNRTVRKRADQVVTAVLMGFSAPRVRFFGRYTSSSQWEQTDMRPQADGTGYQFLIAGVPESLEYYVEAGGVRSQTYKLNVVDLPSVKKIRVTYHYPDWTGMKDYVEDPGGDLRAVQGTVAEVVIETDKPLSNGALLLDDGSKIALRDAGATAVAARVPINKDGMYHLAATEGGEDVRLSEDYFIEAQKDNPPEIAITRPGHDFKASPIEEVTVAVNAKDDFGLRDVQLHYSVNGGPEKAVSLLSAKGAKTINGSTVISLEDFKVVPGDLVSVYASAKGARQTTNTDMFFIEAQPFERNYTQSQQDGGGGGGGGGDDADQQNQIAERQKEIITATWNQIKGNGAKGTDQENATFLSSVQGKLRDQAKSMSNRMKARQIEEAGDAFKTFVDDLDKAVEQMGPASDRLKVEKWQDALAPEQKSLQYLQRAFATFRDIQVAFGNRGGGGGGGGMSGATRDMQGLFDLELDTEKNQYESGRQTQSADARQQQVDDMLQKLQQLARRQQELAEQARKGQQTAQQRWEQEMLRREAEKLQEQMRQFTQNQTLSRNGQQGQQQQQGQQGQQSQSGQSGQSGQAGQSGQMSQGGQQGQQSQQQQARNAQQGQMNDPRLRNADSQQLRQTLDRLEQALQDMRNAASSQQAGTPEGQAEARKAAERLQEAQQMLQGMRSAQSTNQVDELARQAEQLAQRQQDFEGQMRRSYSQGRGVTRDQAENLAQQKESEAKDLKNLEQGMQNAVRDLMTTQRSASNKLREALGEEQQMEFQRDMQRNADYIRQGMGELVALQEAQITAGLNQLRDRLKGVQQALNQGKDGKGAGDDKAMAQALNNMEQLRRQMQQMAGSQQGRNGQGQLNRNGQQAGGRQQNGQQQGGQQQGGQQQGGQQSGGQQQGGQQAGGQQQGGQQGGGQQAGGQQQGGGPQGSPGGPRGGQWTNGQGGYHNGQYYGGVWNPNGGAWDPRDYRGGPISPEQFQTTYRDALQSLNQLQQQLKDDPTTARDIQNLMRDLRQFDVGHYTNDPLLNERIQSALAGVEQVEMELRRKVDDASGGSVRSPGSEPVPQGYADAVADYFRTLSRTKGNR